MAKADLRIPDQEAWRGRIGDAIERTRTLARLSLKEFADRIGRDERQVARWIHGAERPQFDALFAVPGFRALLVQALAELADGVQVETHITIRRTA